MTGLRFSARDVRTTHLLRDDRMRAWTVLFFPTVVMDLTVYPSCPHLAKRRE